jgi:TonB family protein
MGETTAFRIQEDRGWCRLRRRAALALGTPEVAAYVSITVHIAVLAAAALVHVGVVDERVEEPLSLAMTPVDERDVAQQATRFAMAGAWWDEWPELSREDPELDVVCAEMERPEADRAAAPDGAVALARALLPPVPQDDPVACDTEPSVARVETPAEPLAERNHPPEYPTVARRLALEGEVLLSLRVAADGSVVSVAVVASSGHTCLDRAAVRAATTWTFRPASSGGRAREGTYRTVIRFALEPEGVGG